MYHDIEYLREKGCRVEQKNQWHFHIKGKRNYVNVWPSAHKWMVAYGTGASRYSTAEELLEICQSIIGHRRDPLWLMKRLWAAYPITPAMVETDRVWREGMRQFMKAVDKLTCESRGTAV